MADDLERRAGADADAHREPSGSPASISPPADFAAQANAHGRALRAGRRRPRGLVVRAGRGAPRLVPSRPRRSTTPTRRSTSGSRTASSTPPTTASTVTSRPGNGDRVAYHWHGEEGEERDDHLRRPAPRRPALRQRAEGARDRQGRRRRDLPADDPRGRGRDARLRADRRAAQRRLRRVLGRLGPRADGVLRGQGADHRRRRPAQGQDGADQAAGRRGDGRPRDARAHRRGPSHRASTARCRTAATSGTTRSCEAADAECPAEPLDAEHPLFILYTSGSTAKPKGILHTTGGYLTGVTATHRYVFDLKPEDDVYWCSADVGWVTGHSLHRLRPAGQRRHLRDVRGRARLPAQGDLVGADRALRGDHLLHRADRDPRLHEVGRREPGEVRPVHAAAAGLGRRADQPRRRGSGTTR